MPTKLFDSDTGRELAVARHADASPDQRRKNTQAARDARVTVAQIDAKVDLLGAALLDRLDALQAELTELRAERRAA